MSDKIKTALVLVARLGFGVLFVWSGAVKLADPSQFATDVANYRLAAAAAPWLAATLPAVEVLLGVAVVVAPAAWRRAGALAIAGLMAVFTVAVAQAVARGINVSCGCFGAHSSAVTWLTVGRDVALLALAGALAVLDGRTAAPSVTAD